MFFVKNFLTVLVQKVVWKAGTGKILGLTLLRTQTVIYQDDILLNYLSIVVNTSFKWTHGGNNVFLTGTFTGWTDHYPLQKVGNEFTGILVIFF